MKVYIVYFTDIYDSYANDHKNVDEVFSTKRLAQEYVKDRDSRYYDIEDFVVNSGPGGCGEVK
jgi:hypothetical protein